MQQESKHPCTPKPPSGGWGLITEKIGNLSSFTLRNRLVDYLPLEWHEVSKRILHKKTTGGRNVVLKALKEAQNLQQDDVLYADEDVVIAVEILACEAIVLRPLDLYQMAVVCYEIGNRHLPLYYEDGLLLMPYDGPVFKMLQAAGFAPQKALRKLLQPLKTSVLPHAHSSGESLFSKILKLTGNE